MRILTVTRNTVTVRLGRLRIVISASPKRGRAMDPAPVLSVPTLKADA